MRPHHGGTANEAAETQTQPTNQVWLDAIMSQTRVVEPAPLPPPLADHSHGSAGPWPQQPQAEVNMAGVVQDPLGLLHQLRVDDSTLMDAMSDALQELVGEQDCCFIARGLCHLCGTSKQSPVPVVNFCPSFRADHSLCRDHLRSLHRVRMDDLFAGKNRPTVSKRCLKCTICFRSCACTSCQAERRQDLAKYRAWIGAELDRARTGEETLPPPSAEDKQPPYAQASEAAKRVETPQALAASLEDQDMDETEDEEAQPKTVSRQHPKRAAKALPQDLPTAPVDGSKAASVASEPPVEDLSQVGEPSLVQLLSNLNQGGARQSASGESTDSSAVSSAVSSSQGRRRRSITKAVPIPSSTTETDTSNEALGAPDSAEQIEAKATEVRHQKRKRDSFSVDKRSAESSRSSETSFRKKAPAALNLEASAAQGRLTGRGKHSKTPRRDPVAKVSPPAAISTRKRRGPKPKQPKAVERKKYRRDSTRSSKTQQRQLQESDDGDDSELDTNLDYCEVCLGAGDLVCCDKCPRSFHLKCLKMQESDLPEGDWQCAECKKPSYFEGFTVKVASETTVATKCLAIVRCLKSHPFSKPFLTPVENVPHYTSLVEKPMDLSTIERKLQKQQYAKQVHVAGVRDAPDSDAHQIAMLAAFAHDVRLVWSNCKFFNDDGSGITRAADELAKGFNGLYNDVIQFIKRPPAVAPAKKAAPPAAVSQVADTEAKASTPKPTAAPAPAVTAAAVTPQPVESSSKVEAKDVTPPVPESKSTPAASPATIAPNDAAASTTTQVAEPAPVTEATAATPAVAPEPVAAAPEKTAEPKEG